MFNFFLNTIAYLYYPKNLYATDEMFNKTPETQAYLNLFSKMNNSFFKDQLLVLERTLKKKYPQKKINVNQCVITLPCYQIEIAHEKNHDFLQVTTIFISLFIPFYHIINLTLNIQGIKQEKEKFGNSIENHLETNYNFDTNMYDFLKLNMKEIFKYNEFPNEFLACKIPEVFVHNPFEELNYLNAFFTDGYRISEA